MDPRYLPKGFDGCLRHLIEECAEVILAASKVDRFGPDNYRPDDPDKETNIQALSRELSDLISAIERFESTAI